eukprot:jgi/Chlat1/3183/Chrsp22S03412
MAAAAATATALALSSSWTTLPSRRRRGQTPPSRPCTARASVAVERAVEQGGQGEEQQRQIEGRGSGKANVRRHRVTIVDPFNDETHVLDVPEDQYILESFRDAGIELPFACRMGCCTACSVRVKSGELRQPQALGISQPLKEKGYGLLCVGYPDSDLVAELQDEDEVYVLQFGQYFAKGPVVRDDYAIELADMDE